jgi:hypothetical protein
MRQGRFGRWGTDTQLIVCVVRDGESCASVVQRCSHWRSEHCPFGYSVASANEGSQGFCMLRTANVSRQPHGRHIVSNGTGWQVFGFDNF